MGTNRMMRGSRRRGLPLLGLFAVPLLAACAGDADSGDEAEQPAPEPLTVFAAASLNETFTELGEAYTAQTGQPVDFSFAGSSDLVAQLEAGAPADIFASANVSNMDAAGELVVDPVVFVTNTLIIVTAPDNPEQISGFADLANDDLAVVICAPQVPCGDATAELAELNDVDIAADSEESAVTDVLAKVSTGQADAGVVYRTDAASQPDLGTVEIEGAEDVINDYPIALVADSDQREAAQGFIDYVTGPEGIAVLTEAGFSTPE